MSMFKNLVKKKDSLQGEIEGMTEIGRLEFEFDWICTEIERLKKEGREIGLKLANLKGERLKKHSNKEAKSHGRNKGNSREDKP